MSPVLCVDFGSTYTKLTAVDTQNNKIIGTSKAYTTIETHILDGFNNAMAELVANIGELDYTHKLAASSAAGGLKMVAIGLVPNLTANAAKLAACSAGAKLMATYSYELSNTEKKEIEQSKPDIILLCGGTDGGNKDVILHNARIVASIDQPVPVVIAGNKSAVDEAHDIIQASGKQAIVVANVMPTLNELNIAPAKQAIGDIFINQITSAKGLDDAQAIMSLDIVPTPYAAFEACELLSTLGTLVTVDVGGATTDIYSMTEGKPTRYDAVHRGLKEPYAKRSVEGDLGMRYSLTSLVSEAGIPYIAQNTNLPEQEVEDWINQCITDTSTVAEIGTNGHKIDDEIASCCVEIAIDRHAGKLESIYTSTGEVFVQTGKDLSDVKFVIGTGGSIINSPNAEAILSRALASPLNQFSLNPVSPQIIVDRSYILTSMGLLSAIDKDCALAIMKNEFNI